jgi:hypothetical protein
MIKKTIEPTGDLCIKFTEEEMERLGIFPGDKFSFHQDGQDIILKKYATMEFDLSECSREVLEMLIAESINKDVSVNDVISDVLEKTIELNA